MRAIVLSCLGLGDGLIALVLSNNLQRNGYAVDTVHPSLMSLQPWFPHLSIIPLSSLQYGDLAAYDRIFLFHEKTPHMLAIQEFCLKNYPDRIIVLNPIATLKNNYPFWENGKFDGSKTFVDNLVTYCTVELQLQDVVKDNGVLVQKEIQLGKYPKRIVIHPTSSKEAKNWPWEKFKKLSHLLEEEGWDPHFLLTAEEKKKYPPCHSYKSPDIQTLHEMAQFVAESAVMVGNDSGVGHLASCLGRPTLTISRNKNVSSFWRPAWSEGRMVTPPIWLPNLKGMRWRDRHWKKFISVKKVLRTFRELASS